MKNVDVGCEVPGSSGSRLVFEFEVSELADRDSFRRSTAELIRQSRLRAAVNTAMRILAVSNRTPCVRDEEIRRVVCALQLEVAARTRAADWIREETAAAFIVASLKRAGMESVLVEIQSRLRSGTDLSACQRPQHEVA